MAIAESIITGVMSSLAASGMFLYFLYRLRPNIEISPYIAVTTSNDGKKEYRFKFINKTKRPIINIQCKLLKSSPRNVPDGIMLNNLKIQLNAEHIFQVPKFDRKDKEGNYARRIICKEDIESKWEDKDGSRLRLVVMATDSLSGFSKVFSKEFHTKANCIKDGSHKFGESLEII